MPLKTIPLVLSLVSSALAVIPRDGISGKVPVMGWNSFNAYYDEISHDIIVGTAEELISSGLQEAGYKYVNIDDGWQSPLGRDNKTLQMLYDGKKFPRGMDGLTFKLHDLGFKAGVYSDAGTATCGKMTASLYFEELDAVTWADWNFDYVKVDNCNIPETWTPDIYNGCHPDYDHPWGDNGTCADSTRQAPESYNWSTSSTAKRMRRMGDALAKQERTILFSLCNWGQAKVETWGNSTATSWRMTDDINASWIRIVEILSYNLFKLNHVGFWGHNDMDLLQIGNGNLTQEESRSHFALWAALKSPLLITTPVANLTKPQLDILKNPILIGFNQDNEYAAPATPYKWGINPDWTYNKTNPAEFYSGQSKEGTLVLMFNPLNNTETKSAVWGEVPELQANRSYQVAEVWSGKKLGCVKDEWQIDVKPHDTAAILIKDPCYDN